MKRVSVPVLLVAVALIGCGGGSDADPPAAATPPSGSAPAATSQAAPATTTASVPSDADQIKAVADRYVDAFAAKDWTTVCATLTPESRARVEGAGAVTGTGTTCSEIFAATAEGARPRDRPDLSKLQINGDQAEAADAVPDRGDGSTTARYQRVDGVWLLKTDDGS
jgi:hypothetical protein